MEFEGKHDATLTPGALYVDHMTLAGGKGSTIANEPHDLLVEFE